MNVFRLAILEIARQGIWASLTGGWCYEPNNSIFCNTIHLYIWCTLLVLPLLLGIVGAGSDGFSLGLLLAYVGFIAALFLILKLVVSYLHNVFDTVVMTNNGLESSNRVIKDCATLRKTLVLRAFLHAAERMMRNSSMDPDRQAPALVPKISPQVYEEAYKLEQESRPFYRTAINGCNFFVIPSANAVDQNVPELFMQLIQGGYSFEQFKNLRTAFHLVTPSPVWLNFFSCSCLMGGKKSPCKHSVMLMKKQVEPIITVKTKKSASAEQTCRSPVSSFSARATESNVIEMIDLAAERSRHRQTVGGAVRTASLNVPEDGENGPGNDRHKYHHVRIDDPGSSTAAAETGEAEFLSEGFPAKMSSIFEDDKSSFTSSGDSTNELLRKPNSEGTLRRTISSTRRKYSDPNSEFISIKKFNVQRRRSEERPFVRGRLSSNSENRIHSTRSEDRATLRTASTSHNGNWRKSSSGARKAFLVGQVNLVVVVFWWMSWQ
uniref:Pecanex-like protein n=1 Tax=Ditylenchus dipsaci TaxID=166011 RepID=A0A915DSS8_9BILA